MIGSGSPFAESTLRLGFSADLDRDDALALGALAIYEAGDNDPSTGGPDFVRNIFPMMVTISSDGFRELDSDDVAERFRVDQRPSHAVRRRRGRDTAMSNYFYVAPEQLIKDRAEFAQKGIARGRSIVAAIYDVGVVMVAENPSASLYKISEIYDRIAFAGVGKYNEFDRLREAGHPLGRRHRLHLLARRRRRARARQLLRPAPGRHVHRRPEAPRGRDPRGPTGQQDPSDEAVPHRLRGDHLRRAATSRCSAATPRPSRGASPPPRTPSSRSPTTLKNAVRALAGPDRTIEVGDLEVGILEDRGESTHLHATQR